MGVSQTPVDELIRGADEAQSEDDEDCAGEGEGDARPLQK